MAKNYVQEGKRIKLPVGDNVSAGSPVVVGDLVGVALTNSDSNGYATVLREGIFKLSVTGNDGTSDVSISIGDPIYYKDGTLSKDSSGKLFGYALEAVGAGETKTIKVVLSLK